MASHINSDLFKFVMREKKITQGQLAELLHISRPLLCAKVHGKCKFDDYQVAAIRDFMHLTSTEVSEIFYDAVILSKDGIQQVSLLHELNMYIELISKGNIVCRSTLDSAMTSHVIQKFLAEWIRNPEQNVFQYELTELDVKFKHKFFALSEIMIHKIDKKAQNETFSRLFECITINFEKRIITLIINNDSIRRL